MPSSALLFLQSAGQILSNIFKGLFNYCAISQEQVEILQQDIKPNHIQLVLTLFHAGRGIYAPPTTFRQFSPEVLIRGGSNYTLNLSFAIT